jgi:hypothetical protein
MFLQGSLEIRTLIRHRVAIVKIRTMVKNEVHALVDKHGFVSPYSDIFGKGGVEWLRGLELPSLDRNPKVISSRTINGFVYADIQRTSSDNPATVYRCNSCRLDFDLVGTELRVVPKHRRRKVCLEDFS